MIRGQGAHEKRPNEEVRSFGPAEETFRQGCFEFMCGGLYHEFIAGAGVGRDDDTYHQCEADALVQGIPFVDGFFFPELVPVQQSVEKEAGMLLEFQWVQW